MIKSLPPRTVETVRVLVKVALSDTKDLGWQVKARAL